MRTILNVTRTEAEKALSGLAACQAVKRAESLSDCQAWAKRDDFYKTLIRWLATSATKRGMLGSMPGSSITPLCRPSCPPTRDSPPGFAVRSTVDLVMTILSH